MTRLINPFYYIAGGKALAWGLLFLLGNTLLLNCASMAQDTPVHFSYVQHYSFLQTLGQQLLMWLLPALLLWGAGVLLSSSKIRPIDIFGTTAFTQLLMLPMGAMLLFPQFQVLQQEVLQQTLSGQIPPTGEVLLLMGYGFFALFMLIWYYVWNYHAFSVSCNVRGSKAVITFIAAEILTTIIGNCFALWQQ